MSTLVIGSSGKIGKYFVKYLKNDFFFTYHKSLIYGGLKFDIVKDNVEPIIKKKKIKKIIILSGISDPDICFKNRKKSHSVNVAGMKKLINKLIKNNLYFIFFSTEFVYEGLKKNYKENQIANPVNIYGKQKLSIEKFINLKTKNCAIFRIAKSYGDDLKDQSFVANFFNNLIKGKKIFKIAHDQKFSPLYIKDLIKIIRIFLKKRIKGTFNICGDQNLSRFEAVNKLINKLNNKNRKKIKIHKTLMSKFYFLDKRPLDVTMNNQKLKNKIKIKMSNISNVASYIIKKYKLNEKISYRR